MKEKCNCGWLLPLSVFAYPNDLTEDENNDNFVTNVHVCLVCPECNRGHSFYSVSEKAPS